MMDIDCWSATFATFYKSALVARRSLWLTDVWMFKSFCGWWEESTSEERMMRTSTWSHEQYEKLIHKKKVTKWGNWCVSSISPGAVVVRRWACNEAVVLLPRLHLLKSHPRRCNAIFKCWRSSSGDEPQLKKKSLQFLWIGWFCGEGSSMCLALGIQPVSL